MHLAIPQLATGWRPAKGEKDKEGREIPDGVYRTRDFERVISFKSRTEAVARHLSDFLIKTDRFAITIVFCVDQEHAEDMGSEKDIEDARFLLKLFKENLNIVLLKMFLSKLKVSDYQVKRYLGGFDDN